MERREFLQASGVFAANLIVGSSTLAIRNAEADTGLPIAALKAVLDPKKDLVLVSGNVAQGGNALLLHHLIRHGRDGLWRIER